MADALDARDFQARLQRLDSLLQGIDRMADPAARSQTRAIVESVLELHGIGLERLLERVAESGEAGQTAIDACARDEVAGGLLLLHGIHPLGVEDRVRLALDDVRPYLRSHHGDVELVEIHDGVARLRLLGSCQGCPSSSATMKQTVEEAIVGRAPDLSGVRVEGLAGPATTPDGRALIVLSVS